MGIKVKFVRPYRKEKEECKGTGGERTKNEGRDGGKRKAEGTEEIKVRRK